MSGMVVVAVEAAADRVMVHLTISNRSKDSDLYLEKSKALSTPLLRTKLFRIKCKGEEIAYKGPMAKKGPPGPEDFLRLPPGAELKRSAEITSLYGFLAGSHEYTIEYRAFHGDPNDEAKLVELKSEPAAFVFCK